MEAKHELKMVSVRLVEDPPLLGSKRVKNVEDAAELIAKELHDYDRELYPELADGWPADQCQYCDHGDIERIAGLPA